MAATPRTPRVLMVAHGFPPAGGSGSNRALAFARYLPAFGWRPIVLTPGAEWAMHRDDALAAEVPSTLHVVRTRSREPIPQPASSAAGGVRTIGWFRRQIGHARRFPDAHIGWLPYAVAAARTLDFDLIYSSSGPFTAHVAAWTMSRLLRKPWLAELRDGWYLWNRAIFPDYPFWRDRLERRLESAVIRQAGRVLLVTERMAQAFRAQYADLPADHFDVVSNGFDPAQIAPSSSPVGSHPFTVLHAGALYYGRSLASFLEALGSTPNVRLTLLGTLDTTARMEISRHHLGDRVEFLGQQGHSETLACMRQANLLLLVANTTQGAEATVPGKLFEYLAVGRPVLAVAPADSATADIMAETRAGWLAPAGDVSAIRAALHEATCARAASPDPRALARYDRRVLTGKLARVFDEVLAAHRV